MEKLENKEKRTHHGHAIKRLRKSLGIKQIALAIDMGISQQSVSTYEGRSMIEDEMLNRFATVLNVTPDLIKGLEEDPIKIIIENNNFENGSINIGMVDGNNIINNNPIKEILELSREKETLYDRIFELEKEKNELLEKLLNKSGNK